LADKPHNPLINSGALLSASLILQLVKPELTDMAQKYDYLFCLLEVNSLTARGNVERKRSFLFS
jgi:glutaminase